MSVEFNAEFNADKKWGGQPRFDFTPDETWPAAEGEVARSGHKYRVRFLRESGKKTATYRYDFSNHPLRELIALYLFEEAEDVKAATLNGWCNTFQGLEEFLLTVDKSDLNPEVIKFYVRWLFDSKKENGQRRFADSSIPSRVNTVKAFYRFGLCKEQPGWNQQDLDIINVTANKELRGCRKRSVQDSIDKALSLETFTDLAKAVTREFEQCKRVLMERATGKRKSLYNLEARNLQRLDPNPYVVFSFQFGMRNGVRSSEFNALGTDDIHIDQDKGHHKVYLHGPNKADSFIPVDDTFLETLKVCQEWSKEARDLAGPAGRDLFKNTMLVYPTTNTYYSCPLVQFTTRALSQSFLPYFYKKWFNCKIEDESGNERPLLHADGDLTKPLWCDYSKLRNAFAVRFAEREKNRATTSKAMRHKNSHTAEKFYLHQTRLDHAKKVQIALKPEAQLLVMGLKNATAAGISEETLKKARESGAMNPNGICGSALEGMGCRRANDCLECPHLIVIASRKPRLIEDRETYVKQAETLDLKGDYRGAENVRRRATLCQAHVIRIEDMFEGVDK